MFSDNDYDPVLVDKVFENYDPQRRKEIEKDQSGEKKFYIKVPFVPGFSHKLKGVLRKANINVVFGKGVTLKDHLCKLKPKKGIDEKKNAIYSIPCADCPLTYTGQTKQRFKKRKAQHQGMVRHGNRKNGIAVHSWDEDHKIDWENSKIIDTERDFRKRLIKEVLYINADNPSQEITHLMNIKKENDINPCWNQFLSDIKKGIRR